MFRHEIELRIDRSDMAATIGTDPADSTTLISARGTDLTSVWAEALSRMPNDVYQALKNALQHA